MVYEMKTLVGKTPEESQSDPSFDRLNGEGNGKLSLVNLHREVSALSTEKNLGILDIKVRRKSNLLAHKRQSL
jgi:hypothetical protein